MVHFKLIKSHGEDVENLGSLLLKECSWRSIGVSSVL